MTKSNIEIKKSFQNDCQLSICIPTFERGYFLDYLLNSFYDQRHFLEFNFEIIISDNASKDNTFEVVTSWKDRLPVRFFKQETNIGSLKNYLFCIQEARGEFCLYVADDDLLDLSVLSQCVEEFQHLPDVGAYFTPWCIGSNISKKNPQFYRLPDDFLVKKNDHLNLLTNILNYHIFPEICIFRTQKFNQLLPVSRENIAFHFFTMVSEWTSFTNIYFSKRSFYLSISDHPAGTRNQLGVEQVENFWDSYRGGLELILGNCINKMPIETASIFREKINQFIAIRMSVAIRLRIAKKRDKIETFLLASRLRGLGKENLLPIPFQNISVMAAISYAIENHEKTHDKKKLILLGNYHDSVAVNIQKEFPEKEVYILAGLRTEIKNSVIFFQGDGSEIDKEHLSEDLSGNVYFSEYKMLNIKYK